MVKQSLRFFRKQNKGAAIIIVIVAMAFVGILGSTLMWMSLVNYRMKTTDRQVKESFYNAETVFEQIIVGLQNQASDAADHSYSFIMQNYAKFPEEKRNAEFQKEYLKDLQGVVAKSDTETNQYDLQKLMLYVDAGLNVAVAPDDDYKGSWIGAGTAGGGYKSRYGSIVAPMGADYILLKGLHLEYMDEDGFLSVIDTDIMITTPDAGFTQSGKMKNVFDYGIIAEDSIECTEDSGFVTIRGSAYAGENGISVGSKMTVEKADYLVSKGEVLIKDQGTLTVGKGTAAGDVPEFWASDVKIDKSAKTNKAELSLNAHSYIRDDLTVNAEGAKVKLTESYYGYGDSNTQAKDSSAIIVNGVNNTIDLSGVTHLLLAGRAYTTVTGREDPDKQEEQKVDIPTGESIAVKGNQIAYLVPDECIGVIYGQSVYGRNPLTGDEYAVLQSYAKNPEYSGLFTEVDVNRQIDGLDGRSLASYGIDASTGIKKVFIPSNGETLVYYYLKFASQSEAERFFADYYNMHKNKLDRYVGIYASGGIKSNTDYTRITVAGNYLEADPDNTYSDKVELKRHVDSVGEGNDLEKELESYGNAFDGLTTALTTNYLALTAKEKEQTVFENVIDVEKFRPYISGKTYKLTVKEGSKNYMAVLAGKSGVSFTCSDEASAILVIATGDVVVDRNFEGVIITDGKVILQNGCTVTSAKVAGNLSEIVRVLQKPHNNTDTKRPLDFIRDADQYILAGTALTKDEDDAARAENMDFANFVKYQNWTKK